MTISTKPYLLRAIYEWCNDSGFTPYLSVTVDERTIVPVEHVVSGEIVLNLSPSATHALEFGNELITFQARFGGVARQLSVPVECVSAIYARENGHGMAFEIELEPDPDQDDVNGPEAVASDPDAAARPALAAVPGPDDNSSSAPVYGVPESSDDGPDSPVPPRPRPRLTRVK